MSALAFNSRTHKFRGAHDGSGAGKSSRLAEQLASLAREKPRQQSQWRLSSADRIDGAVGSLIIVNFDAYNGGKLQDRLITMIPFMALA